MTDTPTPAGFFAVRTRAMKREGFAGKRVAATMREGRLAIVGEEGGAIWVDPAEITLARIGYTEGKWAKYYQMRIWRAGKPTITLHPVPADFQYRDTMRVFVQAMAAAGRMDRVERGVSAFSAWLPAALFALLTLAASAVAIFVLADALWWQRLVPVLPPAVLLAIFAWNAKARHAPRPFVDLAEVDKQLP